MPGGIHPPLSVILSWPTPNYMNPVTRPRVATILSCVFGPLTTLLLFARLWVRIRVQQNAGLDDWLMIAAIVSIKEKALLTTTASDVYGFNKHVWDVQPHFYVIERKYVMAIESVFCVASGLIKVSILLFYKRLGSRAVSNTYRWAIKLTIAFITAYSIAFALVPIFGCQPISAFWDQVDIIKTAMGYEYKCFNEGADVFSACIISTAQDLLTAILPTFLYWKLQIPIRQKIALFGIFAIGYGVVAIGALRSYFSWQIFFETYDVTWVTWHTWNWTLLEIHMGALCANAPALKIFFTQVLRIKTLSSGSKSHTKSSGTKTSTYSKISMWKSNQQFRQYGHISEPYPESFGSKDDLPAQQDAHVTKPTASKRNSDVTVFPNVEDIELGIFRTQSQPYDQIHSISQSQENLQALPRMPSPYPAALLPLPTDPGLSTYDHNVRTKPKWQSWS
ncbi:integral membrane protein [Paraphaeosphaeria sporulosa]